MFNVLMTASASGGLTSAVTDALAKIIEWVGSVVTAVTTGGLKDLLPLFAIGIGISVLLFGIKAIRSIVWGA